MAKLTVSAVIPAAVDQVWQVIRDFNGLPDWTNFCAESHIEGNLPGTTVGAVRNFTNHDGGHLREQLLALSDHAHSFTYRIVESPFPVANYVSTLKLQPITESRDSFATWEAEFDCDPTESRSLIAAITDNFFRPSLRNLQARFAAR